MKILVTGAAGFIGMHCAQRLLARGDTVIGVDNLSDYYSVDLKKARLKQLEPAHGFCFLELDISAPTALERVFEEIRPDTVLHLAAQPGVRYSIEHPEPYFQTNLVGFGRLLEVCRHHKPKHLVFASSSSVYGANRKMPWSEADNVDHPVSLYAATKKSNELMAHAYCHLYGVPMTGLRFFTVYGPWGRPDMSPMLFAKAILEGKPIQVFNHGDMERDFTYIDDIAEGCVRVLDKPSDATPPYRIFNIGNHQPVRLTHYIEAMEQALGRKAILDMKPMQPGDVKDTYADTAALQAATGFAPSTPLDVGLAKFAAWYRDYHRHG